MKTTPNLEAEASNALVFDNIYAHVGMTASSLFAMTLSTGGTGPVYLDGEPVVIGASIGVVTGNDDVNAEELIHRADALMYTAKQQRALAPTAPAVRMVAA